MAEGARDQRVGLERRLVERLLQGGLAVALALLLAGLLLGLGQPGVPPTGLPLRDLPRAGGLPAHLEGWGILVLGLTPVARVVLLAILWIRERDLRFAAAALVVLAVLAAALAAGMG